MNFIKHNYPLKEVKSANILISYHKIIVLTVLMFMLINTISAQKVLKYSDHEPYGGMRTKFLKEVFFPAIEKESNGRLKIEAHWDGELAKAYDALGAVTKGNTVDMATVVPEYTAKELPLHQIFKSFPVGPSGDKQVSFLEKSILMFLNFQQSWIKTIW